MDLLKSRHDNIHFIMQPKHKRETDKVFSNLLSSPFPQPISLFYPLFGVNLVLVTHTVHSTVIFSHYTCLFKIHSIVEQNYFGNEVYGGLNTYA